MTRAKPPGSAFDPPVPPSSSESARELAGTVAILGTVVAIDVVLLGGLLHHLSMLPAPGGDPEPVDVRALLAQIPELAQTRPPERGPGGSARCTGCDARVSYDSMALNEDGYFCVDCAARMS